MWAIRAHLWHAHPRRRCPRASEVVGGECEHGTPWHPWHPGAEEKPGKSDELFFGGFGGVRQEVAVAGVHAAALAVDHFVVGAAFGHQLLVVAGFDDSAASITTIRSAWVIVLRRWAMTKVVRSLEQVGEGRPG